MKVLVTGAGGFLGGAIAKSLVKKGYEVSSYSRSSYTELDKLGVKQFQGDLSQLETVKTAFEGVDAVMHVAAKAGIFGEYKDFHDANVIV